jgi:hypothetical protein
MWPMLISLSRALTGKAPRTGSRRRRSAGFRPRLTILEDRTVPSALSYSTLLNGTIYATAVDSAGNVYVTGHAGSGFSPTPGAFETTGSGAFVAKLSPTGALLYATYLGNGGGAGTSIALDSAGDAYVIGANSGVPTTANAIASSGGSDFVAELNASGSALNYATYLPGTLNYLATSGYVGAIAVDGSGNINVVGAAGSGLPVTASGFEPTYHGGTGGNDGFFMKINPTLSGEASVVYSSYLGGSSGLDQANGIALDGTGNAYVEGATSSTDFPTTSGAFQTTFASGFGDAFVAKINPALSGSASLVYSTYLGGNTQVSDQGNWGAGYVPNEPVLVAPEIAGGIAVDSQGNAYVTSATDSTNFPTTAGAYQTTSNLQPSNTQMWASDVFVTKLNATGSALVYATYLGGGTINGGGTSSGGAGIAVDASGDAFVTGWTNSTTFPTKNPVQATNGDAGGYDTHGDGMDSFVTELNPAGSGLLFSTYLGKSSNNNDYDGYGIALDSAGNVYVGGATASAGSGNYPSSGYAAKINLAPSPSFSVAGFPSPTTAGASHTFTVTALNADGTVNTGYTGTVHFSSSDPQAVLPADYTFTAADQGVHTFTVTLKTAGSQSITATDTATGSITGSESGIVVQPAAAAQLLISAPAQVRHGVAFTLTVTVEDAFGNVVTGYTGTVQFSSSDSTATLPSNYTFTAADAGVHTFTKKTTLRKRGKQTVKVTDLANGALTATISINVT